VQAEEGMPELVEGVQEMAEGVPQLAPTALEGEVMDEKAAVVQELPEGVPEKVEEDVAELLEESVPPMAEEDVAELLEEGMPAMVAVVYMPDVAEGVVPELEEADEELAGSQATGFEVCKQKTRLIQ